MERKLVSKARALEFVRTLFWILCQNRVLLLVVDAVHAIQRDNKAREPLVVIGPNDLQNVEACVREREASVGRVGRVRSCRRFVSPLPLSKPGSAPQSTNTTFELSFQCFQTALCALFQSGTVSRRHSSAGNSSNGLTAFLSCQCEPTAAVAVDLGQLERRCLQIFPNLRKHHWLDTIQGFEVFNVGLALLFLLRRSVMPPRWSPRRIT